MSGRQTDRLLLNVAEAGELLSMSERSVREAIWRGNLPHVKIGRHVRVPREAIERLVRRAGFGA